MAPWGQKPTFPKRMNKAYSPACVSTDLFSRLPSFDDLGPGLKILEEASLRFCLPDMALWHCQDCPSRRSARRREGATRPMCYERPFRGERLRRRGAAKVMQERVSGTLEQIASARGERPRPEPPPRHLYPYIGGMRAIAVLAVVVFHTEPDFLRGGYSGVDVFFVISGFIVSASLHDYRWSGARRFLAFFYARRLRRIAPALLAMLVTTFFLVVLFVPYGQISGSFREVSLAACFGLANLVLAYKAD